MEKTTIQDLSPLAAKALEIAISQIGKHEQPAGSNKGPEVDMYLASVGLSGGYSWCQAFAHWCYDEAAKALSITNPMPKTAGVIDHWNKAIKNHATIPRKGDLFVLDFGGGHGHIGFVDHVDLAGNAYYTVEGNSNTSGSADGEEVADRRNLPRKILKAKGFLRY